MEHYNPIIGNPAADSAILLRRLAFSILFLVLPTAALIGRRAVVIVVPVAVILLTLAAVLDGAYRPFGQALKKFFLSPGAWLGILFFGWGAISLLWSPFPEEGLERWFSSMTSVVLILLGYFALPERMRSSNLYLLPLGVSLATLVALATELSSSLESRLFNIEDVFQRGLLLLVLMFWPALAWLRSRHRDIAALGMLLVMLAALYFSPGKAAIWAFAVGAFGYLLVKILGERGVRLAAVTVAGLVALAPLLPFVLQPVAALLSSASMADSLKIAQNMMISDPLQLLSGQGLESVTRGRITGLIAPNAPASFVFQVWYELGIVGAWSLAAIIILGIGKAGSKHMLLAPGMIACFLSICTVALMGSGSLQNWWITALASIVLIFMAMTRGQFRTKRPQIFIVRS